MVKSEDKQSRKSAPVADQKTTQTRRSNRSSVGGGDVPKNVEEKQSGRSSDRLKRKVPDVVESSPNLLEKGQEVQMAASPKKTKQDNENFEKKNSEKRHQTGVDVNLENYQASCSNGSTPVKRGRGRPPKKPLSVDDDASSGRQIEISPEKIIVVFSETDERARGGFCKICEENFDDLIEHCAFIHSILVSHVHPQGSRDAASLDVLLQIVGRLKCRKCERLFYKSGRGLLIHESRCGTGDSPEEAVPVVESDESESQELVNGCTLKQLEALHAENGFLTCNKCKAEYRSPVFYFVKHWRECSGKSGRRSAAAAQSVSDDAASDDGVDVGSSEDEINGYTVKQLEALHAQKGFLTCSKCKTDYKSPVHYFVKHWRECNGKVARQNRRSAGGSAASAGGSRERKLMDFPSPVSGLCKLCKTPFCQFDDIFRHYATIHSALYIPGQGGFRRDTSALDEVLRFTGKISCQFCNREFTKSGFSLAVHEDRCPSNPKRSAANGSDGGGSGKRSDLIDGKTVTELEQLYNRQGYLKCSRCDGQYRSPVFYFIKHYRRCGIAGIFSDEEENNVIFGSKKLSEFPKPPISGKCVICPPENSPVDDMFKHYAYEHCVLYTLKEPGYSRTMEALDIVLRLAGKLRCQFCRQLFHKSGHGLLIHEARCPQKSAGDDALPPPVDSEMDDFLVDGMNVNQLEELKNEKGFLTCSRCKADYRSPVLYFIKHFRNCGTTQKRYSGGMVEAYASGDNLGNGPFSCKLCDSVQSMVDPVEFQNHYMTKHACIYVPDIEPIRTPKARELILKKLGKITCPNCAASYTLVPSFIYHEKVCAAREEAVRLSEEVAQIANRIPQANIQCPLCKDHAAIEAPFVQSHYMESHCAIYDPSVGGSCALETKEALEFIYKKLGYLRCPTCLKEHTGLIHLFLRHRDSCDASSEDGVVISKKKRHRKAAFQAIERIGKIVEGEVRVKDDEKDANFEGEIEVDVSSTSSGETGESTSDSDANEGSGLVKRNYHSTFYAVRGPRDVFLNKIYQNLSESYIKRTTPSELGQLLPSRLANLRSEFGKWTRETNPESFLFSNCSIPKFRFETDPEDTIHELSGYTGISSDSKSCNDAVFFVGGRVFAVDAAPLRPEKASSDCFDVWFAVSASSTSDPDVRLSTKLPSSLQFWRIGVDSANQRLLQSQFAFAIGVCSGPVVALQFCQTCPSDDSIGLLAVGGSDQNLVSIIALPSASEVNGKKLALYRQCNSLVLQIQREDAFSRCSTPDGDESSISSTSKRVTALDWSPDGTVLVAALSNADVAVWNLESKSPFFSITDSSNSLLAALVFRAHSHPLSAIRVMPRLKNAIVTLSIDGAVSLFNASNGKLLHSMVSPYSTKLTLLPGNSLPVLVNNPWFVYRRAVTLPGKVASPANKSKPVVSSLSVVDFFGDSPFSDAWPFKPIFSGGSVSCVTAVKEFISAGKKAENVENDGCSSALALGLVTGNTCGDVVLYSTASCLSKIRSKCLKLSHFYEKVVASARLIKDKKLIEFGSCGEDRKPTEEGRDPVSVDIEPPEDNSISIVRAIQISCKNNGGTKTLTTFEPRILIASALASGLIHVNFAQCSSLVTLDKKC